MSDAWVVVGQVAGLYGLKGWVKIVSYTSPRENILGFRPWHVKSASEQTWCPLSEVSARVHGKGIVAQLAPGDDTQTALRWIGWDIAVAREQLGRLAEGEYYWSDLLGFTVVTLDDVELGVIDYFIETGANDVIVVKGERERLIPYVRDEVVVALDLDARIMRVDWDADF